MRPRSLPARMPGIACRALHRAGRFNENQDSQRRDRAENSQE